MTSRPILFNGAMVRAILDGRKTQTRRPVKNQAALAGETGPVDFNHACYLRNSAGLERAPFGIPSARLYCRETWQPYCDDNGDSGVMYREQESDTGGRDLSGHEFGPWRPSIHMRKANARIWLRVDRVWVERVQDIDEEGAKAEGFDPAPVHGKWVIESREEGGHWSSRQPFADTWHAIYGKPTPARLTGNPWDPGTPETPSPIGWDANPWVWACAFTVLSTTGEPS